MPFNGSGDYSLPQSPFQPNTVIASATVNSNFDDIADALTTVEQQILSVSEAIITAFGTSAELTAATIAANVDYVVTQGYTTIGDTDGLQILYARGTTPTQGRITSADGAHWVIENQNPHVGMFGAVGDGTTDDSLAIQNAIDFLPVRGGSVFFGCKTYAVASEVAIGDGTIAAVSSYNGVFLVGSAGVGSGTAEFTANNYGTCIKWTGAVNGTPLKIVGPIHSCGLINIAINGNSKTDICLDIVHSYGGFFRNVLVQNYCQNNVSDTGVRVTTRTLPIAGVTVPGDENTFQDLQIDNGGFSVGGALLVTGSNNNTFEGLKASMPGTGTGIYLQTCTGNTFTGTAIPQDGTGTGVSITFDGTGTGCFDNHFFGVTVATSASISNLNTPITNMISGYSTGNSQAPLTAASVTGFSAGQIKFPATQLSSTNVNTLDDYEEGTFVPTLTFGAASVGMTFSSQIGTYTKIGRQVNFTIFLVLTAKGASTGAALISGLPFTSIASYNFPCATWYSNCNFTNAARASWPAIVGANVTTIKMYENFNSGGAASSTQMDDTYFTNTSNIYLTGTYFTS